MENNQTKICSKCKAEKDTSFFSRNKNTNDGFQDICKLCNKTYRESNKELIKERARLRYINNKQHILERAKKYRLEKFDKIIAYRRDNREKLLKKQKEYNKKRREQQREYVALNKEHRSKMGQIYRENNREKRREYEKNYNKTKNGIAANKNKNHKRRAKEKQGNVTSQQLLELEQNAKTCYWCNCSLKKVKIHIDHYVPLSKGGKHTLSNLVVSCQKCNQTKSAKDPLEFAKSVGRLL